MNVFHLLKELFPALSSASSTERIVVYILIASFLMLFLFFVFTLIVLLVHQIRTKYHRKYYKIFNAWIINYLLDDNVPFPDADLLKRNAFRDALLDLSLIMKGHEKKILLQIYVHKNLWQNDIDLLRSPYWFKRLAAIVRLDLWQFCLGLNQIHHLIYDENIQVRQIAFKNLSRTKDEDEARYLLSIISGSRIFYSTLYEVMSRLIRLHRHLVVDSLRNEKMKALWPIIIKVIGDSRIIEGVELLISFTRSSDLKLREIALESLGKIGDPRGVTPILKSLEGTSAGERLAALKALYEIDQEKILIHKSLLENDSDIEVRSWTNHFLELVK